MAEIRINYRRVWQVKPFETESCELGLTADAEMENWKRDSKKIYQQLAEMADQLMAERLEKHKVQGF